MKHNGQTRRSESGGVDGGHRINNSTDNASFHLFGCQHPAKFQNAYEMKTFPNAKFFSFFIFFSRNKLYFQVVNAKMSSVN